MAATLTADDELTRVAFADIQKWEEDPEDGTLYVYGRASTPEVDTDDQVVSSEFSGKSLKDWLETAPALRVQHNSQRDPAGSGVQVEVNRDGDGAHWVKAAVDEVGAKLLVKKGHLRAFSIGIAKPVIERDITGKARGGIITGGRIVEVSLVDSPANRSCFLELAKADKTGAAEFTGKVFGSDDLLTKTAHDDGTVNVDVPKSATITFSPGDLAKLLEHRAEAEDREAEALKAVMAAESEAFKRDIDTATRRRLASQGRALPGNPPSYPIETHEDAGNAVTLALSGHGDADAAKRMIRRIASKEGWQDILDRLENGEDSGDGASKAADVDAGSDAAPDVAKADAEDEGGSEEEGGLHHDDGQDDDTDSDADAMDKAADVKAAEPAMTKPPKVPCPSCKKPNKAKAKFCGKCGAAMTAEKASKPTPADHAEGAGTAAIQPVPEHREPDGPAFEAFEHDAGLPTVPDADVMQRTAAHHKAIGVPYDAGWLHDLLCPAYDPATAKAAHPLADLSMLDELAWQAKALDTAASAPLDQAREAALLWQHARTVKVIPSPLSDEILTEAHKAFRDANPGPGTAPVPGEIRAERYHRPYISDGHAAPSPGQDPPHRDPVHAGHISASDFHRGPLDAGHAEDSPGNMNPRPEPIGAPEVPGVPSRVYYTRMQRDNARQAMTSMHDHIARTFPDVCPMHGPGQMGEPGAGTRPVPAGVGGPVPHGASKGAEGGEVTTEAATETAPVTRITPKQLRRKLEKAVFAGEMTLEDAQVQLGTVQKAATADGPAIQTLPEIVKAAVRDALHVETVPLEAATIEAFDPSPAIEAALTKAVAPLLERLEKQDKRLKEQGKVLDAIADQPDPNVTAYRGVALGSPATLKTSAPPAGGTLADHAERAQATMFNAMYTQWRTASNPEEREHAWDAMREMTGLASKVP